MLCYLFDMPEVITAAATSFAALATFLAVVVALSTARRMMSHQHRENKFARALDNLASSDPLRIEIGTYELARLTKCNEEFKDEVRFAFTKRLQQFPMNKYCEIEMRTRLTYAQWILIWLYKNCRGMKIDLGVCDFTNQDFVTRNSDMTFDKLFSMPNVECSFAKFRNARICKKWLSDNSTTLINGWIAAEEIDSRSVYKCNCDKYVGENLQCKQKLSDIPALTENALRHHELG